MLRSAFIYNCVRAKGETIAVGVLHACDFGESLPTMLKDCLVYVISHEGTHQHQLLAEKHLTFKKAHKLAVTLEAAAKGSKEISTTATQQTESLHKECQLYAKIRKDNSPMGQATGCTPD